MKKVLNALVNILVTVFLIFSIVMTVMVIISTRDEDRIPSLFGYAVMNVLSDSMEGENGFYVGDMIVVRKIDAEEANNLKVGDVITFRRYIDNQPMIETHRIVENNATVNTDGFENISREVKDGVWYHGGVSYYLTQGDNTDGIDFNVSTGAMEYASRDNIIGVWEGTRIPKLGSALQFLQSQLGFMLCVVLPIALFFIYQLYIFIATLSAKKKEEALAAVSDKEAELKAKAVAEFLAQQQAQTDNAAPAEQPELAPAAEKKETKEEKPAETAEISEEDKARIIAEYMAKQAEALHKKDAEQEDQ
ncbi:MAG: signal peptidase I [Acutalibacteraceae bacterium]